MDPALLTSAGFWDDSESPLQEIPELAGHVLFETSGSTGSPKWVALSKPALLASAAAVNRHLAVNSDSCWGLALPLNHVGGFGVAARAWQAGCGLQEFGRRWDAAPFRDWIARSGITHTSLVPAQVHDLVKARLTAPAGVTAIVVGGGHLDHLTGQTARDRGWPVLASYGMTEAASQIATQGLDQLDSLYQPAPIPLLPVWDARISADGLLEISGPALFSGYVSGGKFSPRDSEWHTTSDRVALDGNSITPLGRSDRLIKILGELVDPDAIEHELTLISGGKLAAGTFTILCVPDERAGNALIPVFELSVDPVVVESALKHYEDRAPGFRRLRPPLLVERLPRSALGKLRRAELAAFYQQSTGL
jgi:O-succinylbenzoic acid--CoA ligase